MRIFTLLMIILFLVNVGNNVNVMAQTNSRKLLRSLWCPKYGREYIGPNRLGQPSDWPRCYYIPSPNRGREKQQSVTPPPPPKPLPPTPPMPLPPPASPPRKTWPPQTPPKVRSL
ncbi:hypothetical protein RND81_06G105500 [Saponaria officinalis]|uniref:Uncharacterized protein n=1 Tax=Saponaria officinalis TaxID=3572 RepID=A0AAW1KA55_SAPOF